MPPILFASESYTSHSLPLSAQRVVNAFVEAEHPDAKSQMPIFGAPGLTLQATAGGGPIRAAYDLQGVIFVVSGGQLYKVIGSAATLLNPSGPLITGSDTVSMADNGTQLCIVNGDFGYIYDISANTFQQITDPNFFPARTVAYFDTYFVFDKKGTNQFFLSNPNDGLTYDPLLTASAEAESDYMTGLITNLELLFLFGEKHIEMWYDTGAADFPFQRYAGGVLTRGCVSPYTIIRQDDAIFFLCTDGRFYRLQGSTPIPISTPPIENIIASAGDVTTAFCFTYTFQGHKMVHLTLPSINASLVWDIQSSRWHERESFDIQGNSLQRWRGNAAAQLTNQILIGDVYSGAMMLLDWDTFTEMGNPLEMSVTSVPIHSDKKRVFISRLEFDFEQGVGTTTGQGSSPNVMMDVSKDGGRTWKILQPWRSLGKIGEYLRRQRYLRLGQARVWVFRFRISDPVKRVMIQAHADISVGQ
jgi:hypothetical protein